MLDRIIKYIGPGTALVILITLVLFIAAIFVKGLTHDLLLETAVFLVSVKLMIMGYRNSKGVETIQEKLDNILSEEKHLEKVLDTIKKNQSKETNPGQKKGETPELH